MQKKDLAVIRAIAELLRRDLRYFARLSGHLSRGSSSSESLQNYAKPRVRSLVFLTGALEHFSGIRWPGERVPYCYMRADWPEDAPIAGYIDDSESLGWLIFNRTLVSNWALDLEGCLEIRLKPVALWMVYKHGVAALVDYLLDMLDDDQIIHGRSVAGALTWVLSKIAGNGAEEERVGLLLHGRIPASPSKWMDILDDDPSLMSHGDEFNREDVQLVVSRLIARCVAVIRAVRYSACNFDSWMLGQAKAGRFVEAALVACAKLLPDPPMSLRAVLSQFEEIRADSGAFFWTQEEQLPLNSTFILALTMKKIFRMQFGEEGIDRLLDERLLIPALLTSSLSEDDFDYSHLSERWRKVSWKAAAPLCAARSITRSLELMRSSTPDPDRILLDEELQDVLIGLSIDDEVKKKIIEKEMVGEKFYEIEYDREAVGIAMASAIDRISGADLVEHFIASKEDSDEHELAAVASRTLFLLALFPWNWLLHLELGIARDRQGLPNIAVKHLIAAILLAPNESMHWQSLSVVLERMDRSVESSIASAMKDVLKHSRDEDDLLSEESQENEVSSD